MARGKAVPLSALAVLSAVLGVISVGLWGLVGTKDEGIFRRDHAINQLEEAWRQDIQNWAAKEADLVSRLETLSERHEAALTILDEIGVAATRQRSKMRKLEDDAEALGDIGAAMADDANETTRLARALMGALAETENDVGLAKGGEGVRQKESEAGQASPDAKRTAKSIVTKGADLKQRATSVESKAAEFKDEMGKLARELAGLAEQADSASTISNE